MHTTMIAHPPMRVDLPLDATLLARLIPVTDPDLYADLLDGETNEERSARLAAAADITDDLLAEAARTVIDEAQGWDL